MNRTRSVAGCTPAPDARPALPAPAGTALVVPAAAVVADRNASGPSPQGIR